MGAFIATGGRFPLSTFQSNLAFGNNRGGRRRYHTTTVVHNNIHSILRFDVYHYALEVILFVLLNLGHGGRDPRSSSGRIVEEIVMLNNSGQEKKEEATPGSTDARPGGRKIHRT